MMGALRDDLVLMGVVGKPHGVRGDVRVVPETDDPARFEDFHRILIEVDGVLREYEVERVRMQTSARGVVPILSLAGLADRTDADMLRGRKVFVPEEDLELEENEFFLHDLVDLDVRSEEGEQIGSVKEVLSLPAGPVLVVGRADAPDAMIPVVPEFVIEVTEDRVVVRLIEGLLDL